MGSSWKVLRGERKRHLIYNLLINQLHNAFEKMISIIQCLKTKTIIKKMLKILIPALCHPLYLISLEINILWVYLGSFQNSFMITEEYANSCSNFPFFLYERYCAIHFLLLVFLYLTFWRLYSGWFLVASLCTYLVVCHSRTMHCGLASLLLVNPCFPPGLQW